MDLAGKKVAVIGLGRSGAAAARFLHRRGARLVLIDRDPSAVRNEEIPPGELQLGPEDTDWMTGIDLAVTSPGVPRQNILLTRAVQIGVPVWSELELAARFFPQPIIAITGTNGKSTVTTMIGEIFKMAGEPVFVGGNLGTPLIEAADKPYAIAIIEVSSFQLEWIETFHPHVGIHLNLSEDHLDRYRDLEDYGRAKAALFSNQISDDWAILNRDDPHVFALAPGLRSQVITFGHSAPGQAPFLAIEKNEIVFDLAVRRGRVRLDGMALTGRHNAKNAMAAAAAALAMGLDVDVIERGLASFNGLPHRIEKVRERGGVIFIDDSKGTNVGAVIEALAAVPGPVILIAGGVDKGGDYSSLVAPLREKVKRLILFGAARDKMRGALEGAAEIAIVTTLAEAVALAAVSAQAGDTVMLSPACASFDQFRDYAERGNVFKELVRAL
ncbi:MAG: UDP-N-acetylmuramoyl-L-alanine--D-glutamate ligase [Candidatus Binataceae bacterium]|nr:UDP-N-acetylmuramoyl-L-alanine--D-glutamate ligase [Candidatus Binataceae bacterium]